MTQYSGDKKVICGPIIKFKEYIKGLGEFYFEKCEENGENIFQIDAKTGLKETYASIKERSTRLAVNLKKLGVASKDVIMICSSNTMDNCIPHFGALFLGAKTAALHHNQSVRDWTHCMKIVTPTIIFVEENSLKKMEECLENLNLKPNLLVFGQSEKYKTFDDLQKPSVDESTFHPFVVNNCNDTAVILFSSGTTGPPKGMLISHYSLINKAINLFAGPFKQNFIGLTYSTLYWISSVLQLAICFQTGGAKIVSPSECNPKEMLEWIEKYQINYIFMNPIMLKPIFTLENTEKYDTSSLKFITTVGVSLHESELKKLRKIFKNTFVSQAYGTSETLTSGTGFTLSTDTHLLEKLHSVGKVTPNCKIKVVDSETDTLLGPNKSGEIFIKSPFRFSGYCNLDCVSYFDKEGFFKTGDLGYYDEDECFFIVGRLKDTFKYRTFHVSPNYLESIIQEHPDVLYAGVFGIPNEKDGYLPAACIVLKEDATSTVDDIENFYTKNVSDWHKLRGGIKIVKSMPMTPTLKIQRNKLLDLYLERKH